MDIPRLLKSLNDHDVKYVIIGATAFPVHGYSRNTLDTDIFIDPTTQNAEKTRQALIEFGYDMTDISVDDLLTKKVLVRGYVVQSDFHPYVAGIKDFAEVWNSRIETQIFGVKTNFTDLDNLIKMKEAAGRPKDLEDLKYLRAIKLKKNS